MMAVIRHFSLIMLGLSLTNLSLAMKKKVGDHFKTAYAAINLEDFGITSSLLKEEYKRKKEEIKKNPLGNMLILQYNPTSAPKVTQLLVHELITKSIKSEQKKSRRACKVFAASVATMGIVVTGFALVWKYFGSFEKYLCRARPYDFDATPTNIPSPPGPPSPL